MGFPRGLHLYLKYHSVLLVKICIELSSLIGQAEDMIFALNNGVAKAPPIHAIRLMISYGLSKIERLEFDNINQTDDNEIVLPMQEPDKTFTCILILNVVLWSAFAIHQNKSSADTNRISFYLGFLACQ